MELPPFPPLSSALIKALDARFPNSLPPVLGDYQKMDFDALGKIVLRNLGRRDVVDILTEELSKQRAKVD